MAKKTNPLDGLTRDQIRSLVESAQIDGLQAPETDDSDEPETDLTEVIIRGKDAASLLEALGFPTTKSYDPDETKEDSEEVKVTEPLETVKSFADKLFGADK